MWIWPENSISPAVGLWTKHASSRNLGFHHQECSTGSAGGGTHRSFAFGIRSKRRLRADLGENGGQHPFTTHGHHMNALKPPPKNYITGCHASNWSAGGFPCSFPFHSDFEHFSYQDTQRMFGMVVPYPHVCLSHQHVNPQCIGLLFCFLVPP